MNNVFAAKFIGQLLNKKRNNEGFTLIELLVVIIIIGILAAIALPSFLNQANKARQSEAQTYVGSINRAHQAYFLENNEFGPDLTSLELGISDSDNYEYTTAGDDAAALTQATPVNTVLKGYAGGVKVGVGSDGTATTLSRVCEGTAGTVPADCTPVDP